MYFDILLENINDEAIQKKRKHDASKYLKGAAIGAITGAAKGALVGKGVKSASHGLERKVVGSFKRSLDVQNKEIKNPVKRAVHQKYYGPDLLKHVKHDIHGMMPKHPIAKGAAAGAVMGAAVSPAFTYGMKKLKKTQTYKKEARPRILHYFNEEG
jgi:hypothetical protein